MRLLRYEEDGRLTITRFDGNATPRYAILSHTWGTDAEEVTFADLTKGDGEHKPGEKAMPSYKKILGYKKIRFCGEQAQQDGLQYFWVDTCCIDRSDKAELSSAIQSMFRWYQDATKCYVYLSDVSTKTENASRFSTNSTWESAFRLSRWFIRGWTLQELLAPSVVEFFSQEWKKLGDKMSLKLLIHKITGISYKALEGTPLSQFSINERLRWREGRVTKYEEDGAYSLQGILDVELAPLYGEGAVGAFRRLMDEINISEKCIQDIRSTDPHDDKKRIEESKGGLLANSYQWVLENASFQRWQQEQHSRLLWIKGDAGKGKTMLLCGIVNELKKSTNNPLLFFFCQGTDSRINNAAAVLRGLIYLLVRQQPWLKSHLRKRYDQAGGSLFQDANACVALSEVFTSMMQDEGLKTTYLVVDALDECVVDLPKLLDLIVSTAASSSRVKWLVSSRNENQIEQKLRSVGDEAKLSLELKQNADEVARAVDAYIDYKLSCLESLGEADLRKQVRDELHRKANGTFLWVALVVQELEKPESWDPLAVVEEAPAGLYELYDRMMEQIRRLSTRNTNICQSLLCTTAVAHRPLHLAEMGSLCGSGGRATMTAESVRKIVAMCGSFLTVRDEQVYLVHQSAKDYLSSKMAAAALPSQSEMHHSLFCRSLELMSITLERDMYNLVELGFPIDEVKIPTPDPLATARYSCVYWVDHLHDSVLGKSASDNKCLQDDNVVHAFLKQRYLYWLEALSLCRCISAGVVSMTKLATLVQEIPGAHVLREVIHDARRFIMYHRVGIENSPLQAYASALLFSPSASLVRRHFQHEEPKWISIKPAMEDGWSACLQTFEGHSKAVSSVTFSHDSTRLASASEDSTIKIWDVSSGACLQTLKGHSKAVSSVVFSHNSTRLVSASYDSTVKVWDVSNGACLQTLKGYDNPVNSVASSHDSTRIASGSWHNIKIWDASSGLCLQTLKGHNSTVNSVAFSHDSIRLASASNDSVKIWNTSSGACLQTFGRYSGSVSIAFSNDSTQLASVPHDKIVEIWDVSSGACLQKFTGHSDYVNSVAFSHSSTKLTSASWDGTVKIWDVNSGACLQTFTGHTSMVYSVAFSHDSTQLASGSHDNMVKIWDTSSGAFLQMLKSHSSGIHWVAFSHDATRLASASEDSTIKIWDVSSGACLQIVEGHKVLAIAFSHDSTRLASASTDKTVKIWDASSGACLQTLQGYSSGMNSVVFSHDSTLLASASLDGTVKIWDASSGTCLQTLRTHSNFVTSIAFSRDSIRLLASASCEHAIDGHDVTVEIWDVSSGACLQKCEGHDGLVCSVAFSHDSTRLASTSDDKTVKIWDTSSGACLQTIKPGYAALNLSFDPSGVCIYTEYGSIAINASTSSHAGHNIDHVHSQASPMALSSDRTWITRNGARVLWVPSEYRAIRATVFGNIISIRTGSGALWMCRFDSDRDL